MTLLDCRIVDWTDRNCSLTAQASSALLTLQEGVSIPRKPSPVKQGLSKPVVANIKKTTTSNVHTFYHSSVYWQDCLVSLSSGIVLVKNGYC